MAEAGLWIIDPKERYSANEQAGKAVIENQFLSDYWSALERLRSWLDNPMMQDWIQVLSGELAEDLVLELTDELFVDSDHETIVVDGNIKMTRYNARSGLVIFDLTKLISDPTNFYTALNTATFFGANLAIELLKFWDAEKPGFEKFIILPPANVSLCRKVFSDLFSNLVASGLFVRMLRDLDRSEQFDLSVFRFWHVE